MSGSCSGSDTKQRCWHSQAAVNPNVAPAQNPSQEPITFADEQITGVSKLWDYFTIAPAACAGPIVKIPPMVQTSARSAPKKRGKVCAARAGGRCRPYQCRPSNSQLSRAGLLFLQLLPSFLGEGCLHVLVFTMQGLQFRAQAKGLWTCGILFERQRVCSLGCWIHRAYLTRGKGLSRSPQAGSMRRVATRTLERQESHKKGPGKDLARLFAAASPQRWFWHPKNKGPGTSIWLFPRVPGF